jgi:hypothetical protein
MSAAYISPVYQISFQIASDEDPACLLDAAQAAAENMATEFDCALTENERSQSASVEERRSDESLQILRESLDVVEAWDPQTRALQIVIATARRVYLAATESG